MKKRRNLGVEEMTPCTLFEDIKRTSIKFRERITQSNDLCELKW